MSHEYMGLYSSSAVLNSYFNGHFMMFLAHSLVYRQLYTYYLDTLIRLQFNQPCDRWWSKFWNWKPSKSSKLASTLDFIWIYDKLSLCIMISLTPWFVLDIFILGPSAIGWNFILRGGTLQDGAPQVISWFIIPLTIYIYIYHKS